MFYHVIDSFIKVLLGKKRMSRMLKFYPDSNHVGSFTPWIRKIRKQLRDNKYKILYSTFNEEKSYLEIHVHETKNNGEPVTQGEIIEMVYMVY